MYNIEQLCDDYYNDNLPSEAQENTFEQISTIIINLAAGPGAGKSTAAAGIFYELKRLGYSCELVTEFAKDKVWEESYKILKDQIYIFGKQYHRLWKLNGKVQFIITDTCLPLSIQYSPYNSETFNNFVIETFNTFTNVIYFIKRGNTFQNQGRIQNLNESIQIDNNIKNIFTKYNLEFEEVSQQNAVNYIVSEIKKYFPI